MSPLGRRDDGHSLDPQQSVRFSLSRPAADNNSGLTCSVERGESVEPERMHTAMRQGLRELSVAVLDRNARHYSGDARPPEPQEHVVLRDVLALGCRALVADWLREKNSRHGIRTTDANAQSSCNVVTDFQKQVGRYFPLSTGTAGNDSFGVQETPEPLQYVVQCAWNLAETQAQANHQVATMAWEWLLIVYERALQLVPELHADKLVLTPGVANRVHARRTTGSYYTPQALVESTLDAALEPVIDERAVALKDRPDVILGLRLVDPACGTGRFLVAAGHRLTQRLMAERGLSNKRDTPLYSQVYAEVVRQCIYGVDLDPLTVGWCQLSLWIHAGLPSVDVPSLTSGVRCGNALLGAPAGFEQGIPEAAWLASSGDCKATARRLRLRHRTALSASGPSTSADGHLTAFSGARQRIFADIWCASFFMRKQAGPRERCLPTHDRWLSWQQGVEEPPSTLVKETHALAQAHAFFHWPLEYTEVLATGGFDVVLGNPPWIAHAGRAAQPLEPAIKAFYAANYEAFSGYRTTHALFISLAARLLRPGGRLGLIVPSSVSELEGYRAARRAHDRLCDFPYELQDFGEGLFPGVTQPCMALVSRRAEGGRQGANHGAAWPLQRPDLNSVARGLLHRLEGLPRLPAELFGERGMQSDGAARQHFMLSCKPQGRFTTPIREGSDVREFALRAARWHVDPLALGKRLRPAPEYQCVRILVRQTARYPIAAMSDGMAFRNSLLAGYSNEQWCAAALVALLNSTLIRWLHYARFRDARQPVLPQVKIAHLRAIPAPAVTGCAAQERLSELGECLSTNLAGPGSLLTGPATSGRAPRQTSQSSRARRAGSTVRGKPNAQVQSEKHRDARKALDTLVYDIYGLDEPERALLDAWYQEHAADYRGAGSA